jgi:thimet oligopeptidase
MSIPLPLRPLVFALASTFVACGGGGDARQAAAPLPSGIPPASEVPAAKMRASEVIPAPLDIDPVEIGLQKDGTERLCEESLARARLLVDEVRALERAPDHALTWDATLGTLDRAKLALRNAGDFPALMAVAHPEAAVREQAKACEPKIETFETGLWLDPSVAAVVKRFAESAAKPNAEPLEGPRAHLLERVLRELRRNGLELDPKGQARLRELNRELTKLGQDFDSNLAASHLFVEATPEELDGLPDEWLRTHPPGEGGKVRITTDYPDFFPVLTYAKNRKLALELYKKFDNRAADTNVAVLEKMLALRHEKAKLLGYASWADYVLEPRMAKDAKTVEGFLESLRKHLAPKGKKELAEFRAMHVKLGGKATDEIPPSDRLYLEDQVRKARYGLDSKEVSQYFEVARVKEGLLAITSRLFDVRYRKADVPIWHPEVEAMEVTDANGKVLGRFYFDLHPREGKYKHAAVFSIRDTATLQDGSRLVPVSAIVCNFPRAESGTPALMSHQDAVTFFHEFGHVLHHLLSESELSTFAGTSVARDFVESPSQMLEEWAWSKETLDLFAFHHQTGKKLPKELYAAMQRSRSFGRAIATQRQLFLAALDQAYHTRAPGFDTTKVLAEVHDAYMPFKYVKGTHFQASFGHLIGYDAGYYGYQWALSIARDLFTRFKKAGLLDTKTAADYRAAILAPGGSADEAKLVERFLGRPPSDAAYKAFLLE